MAYSRKGGVDSLGEPAGIAATGKHSTSAGRKGRKGGRKSRKGGRY